MRRDVTVAVGRSFTSSQTLRQYSKTPRLDRSRIWFVVLGAVIGLALGILVSVTTDVPFAPEAGLLVGAVFGWLLRRDGAL